MMNQTPAKINPTYPQNPNNGDDLTNKTPAELARIFLAQRPGSPLALAALREIVRQRREARDQLIALMPLDQQAEIYALRNRNFADQPTKDRFPIGYRNSILLILLLTSLLIVVLLLGFFLGYSAQYSNALALTLALTIGFVGVIRLGLLNQQKSKLE
jgi:hypothetical protein